MTQHLSTIPPSECYARLTTLYSNFADPNAGALSYPGGIDYPWTKFPPNAQSFAFQNSIPTPGVDTIFHNVIDPNNAGGILVPLGYDGVINVYSCNFTAGGFVDGSGDLIWQIQANGVPIKNFEQILTERGDPNQPISVNTIRIYSGQLIRFVINHANNVSLSSGFIICSLAGYFYPNT